jgi:hypothetical protein
MIIMPNVIINDWPLQSSPESGYAPFAYTTGSWTYGMSQVCQVSVTNPTTVQSKPGLLRGSRVELQLSNDSGMTFKTAASWQAGIEPSRTYIKSWWLGDYANLPDFNTCRIVFFGAVGGTVTIRGAYDGGTSGGVSPMLGIMSGIQVAPGQLEYEAANWREYARRLWPAARSAAA